jgi:hypothetical protein
MLQVAQKNMKVYYRQLRIQKGSFHKKALRNERAPWWPSNQAATSEKESSIFGA